MSVREMIEEILAKDVGLVKERMERKDAELALEDARKLCMVYDSLLRGESLDRKASTDEYDQLTDEDLLKHAAELQQRLRGKR